MGLLPGTENCELPMRRECRERFPCHRGLAIPACITARAWGTCRDTCRDRQLAVSFEVGGGENVLSIPPHAQPQVSVSGKRPTGMTRTVVAKKYKRLHSSYAEKGYVGKKCLGATIEDTTNREAVSSSLVMAIAAQDKLPFSLFERLISITWAASIPRKTCK